MISKLFAIATLAVAAFLIAGCAEDDKDTLSDRDQDHDGIADRYDRHPRDDDRLDDRISRDRRDQDLDTRDLDRDRRGLDDIPRDAVRVEEGVGQTLRYEAERDGRVYVYDEDDDRVVYSGKLYRGEDFVADPDRDVLSVNGKRLNDVNLRAKHRYRVYFGRD
jgi:hypothetical protein